MDGRVFARASDSAGRELRRASDKMKQTRPELALPLGHSKPARAKSRRQHPPNSLARSLRPHWKNSKPGRAKKPAKESTRLTHPALAPPLGRCKPERAKNQPPYPSYPPNSLARHLRLH